MKNSDELEGSIKEQTAELAMAKEQLQQEIGARKRAEAELERLSLMCATAVQEWEQTFDSALDIIAVTSPNFEILRINRAGCEAVNKKREELIGEKCHKVIHGLDRPIDGCPSVKMIQTREPGRGEITDRGRQFIVTASPIFKENNGLVAFVHTLRDITERKRAEDVLRESEGKFRNLVEKSFVGVYLVQDGVLKYANPRLAEMFGYTVEEITGKQVKDMVFPEDWPIVEENFRKRLSGEVNSIHYEPRGLTKNQEVIYVEAFGSRTTYQGQPAVIGALLDITERKQAHEKLESTLESLRKALGATIRVAALTVETKDPYTAGHQKRVANLARAIATEMGLSKDKIEAIRMAGVIHDIGKISVPSEILTRPGKINEIEMALIMNHSQVGYDILKTVDFPWPIAQMVLQHHERMDGSGYPQGIAGEDICLEARILAVADVVEAMASHRPYRPALGIEKALEEISNNKGILYDPAVVDACIKLFSEKEFDFERESALDRKLVQQ